MLILSDIPNLAIYLRFNGPKFSDVQITIKGKTSQHAQNPPKITERLPGCYNGTRANEQSGREFTSGPAFYLLDYTYLLAPKIRKKAKNKKHSLFRKKIGKNYCGIKNYAYLCIESNGDSTDAAGSANTKQDRQ